jgi:threonyl-tRNA synthetase
MINITFPDGSIKQYSAGVTGLEIASQISKSLEKAALAIKFNGKLLDAYLPLNEDGTLEIVTLNSADGLEIIRHDAAHLLAQATKELYPETQLTIGPVIENGFYYDFYRDTPFTPEDLLKIEARMKEISQRNLPIRRLEMTHAEAKSYFAKRGEGYKVEIIDSIPSNESITVYTQGDFSDPCRGPHSPTTAKVKAFKLTKVSGAYWRGDSNNVMLQRVYGTAWANDEQLQNYLTQIEEAEKRDHRKLAKELDLFHFQEDAPGSVFWHPKGWTVFQELINYMRKKQNAAGYQEISTPEVLDKSLWEQSGHWEKFGQNMFTVACGDEDRVYALKPMNCPGGVQVFKQGLKSYRDLPLRLSEFGKVHRYEPSGALHGLMRVRAFTQDDAHVFCTEDQLLDECKKICDLALSIYKDFGFENVVVKFSDRPEKRIGSDEIWDKSETALKEAAKYCGLETILNPGEGAFYGPKLEFTLKDAIGRDWQVGTLQVDLNLPQRFNATYIGEDGNKHQPVMLHRALFGSLERFLGILIEHHWGRFPLWLAPVQVAVLTITNEVDDYAYKIFELLRKNSIRTEIDLENEKINYKIRKHSLAKVPIILAVGRNEAQTNSVSVRRLGDTTQEILEINDFLNKLLIEATVF